MHICRGNGGQGGWHTAGGYDAIAEQVFTQLKSTPCCWSTTATAPAASSPCASCRRASYVVLGLVTTKSGDAGEGRTTSCAASKKPRSYVRHRRPGPQPAVRLRLRRMGNPVTPEEQRKKLELVVEVASKVWG